MYDKNTQGQVTTMYSKEACRGRDVDTIGEGGTVTKETKLLINIQLRIKKPKNQPHINKNNLHGLHM
jgi:hypothetical protein